MSAVFSFIVDHYNWQASITVLLLVIATIAIGTYIVFKVPDLQRMRLINIEEDKRRLAQEKYPPLIRSGMIAGFSSLLFFLLLILPFCATFEHRSIGGILLDIVIILMVYDFFYYVTHRFVFHGNATMRRIHGIHHQARDPSWIDAHYVHPIEIAIGLWLFLGTIMAYAIVTGPIHIAVIVVTFIAFLQINVINHTYFKLPYFPYKTINWIVARHHVHHQSMQKGNYATITLFYDKVFGTLE
jgi:sterol desaturase/sphingolipid hydroxylase (fatty acid hydroxylase superfamily)